MKVKFDRWPWQYSCTKWHMGRFGGGWKYSLGFKYGGRTIIFDLLFGSIRISWEKKKLTQCSDMGMKPTRSGTKRQVKP